MGPPRLASLALLLLALCRPASSDYTWTSVNTAISSSSNSLVKDGKKVEQQMFKPKGGSLADLFKYAGNTVVMLGLQTASVLEHMPNNIQLAFMNGILCELDQSGLEKLITKALYGQDSVPPDERKHEETFFREKLSPSVDCSKLSTPPTPAEECFCTNKYNGVYCVMKAAEKAPTVPSKKTCRQEAINGLKAASPEIFSLYDLDSSKALGFSKSAHSGNVDSVANEDAVIGKLLCEATKPNVKSAVETLYAADALYWMTEAAVMTILFGEAEHDIKTVCADKAYTASKYGQCLCELKTGFSFCIYKVLGDFFVEKGYLKCDGGAPAYDKTKKPDSLPQLSPPSSPAAATSGLLLLPAAAAAAMLLQGH